MTFFYLIIYDDRPEAVHCLYIYIILLLLFKRKLQFIQTLRIRYRCAFGEVHNNYIRLWKWIIDIIITLKYCHNRFVSCVCTEEAEPEEPEPASNAYGRRRSRAVLYQLSGHYKSDKPKTGKLKLNNVSFVLREFVALLMGWEDWVRFYDRVRYRTRLTLKNVTRLHTKTSATLSLKYYSFKLFNTIMFLIFSKKN